MHVIETWCLASTKTFKDLPRKGSEDTHCPFLSPSWPRSLQPSRKNSFERPTLEELWEIESGHLLALLLGKCSPHPTPKRTRTLNQFSFALLRRTSAKEGLRVAAEVSELPFVFLERKCRGSKKKRSRRPDTKLRQLVTRTHIRVERSNCLPISPAPFPLIGNYRFRCLIGEMNAARNLKYCISNKGAVRGRSCALRPPKYGFRVGV